MIYNSNWNYITITINIVYKIIKDGVLLMVYSPEIRAVLRKMKKAKDINMFKRYQTIYLWLKDRQLQEIADTERLCRRTVINYINSYKNKRTV